MSLTTDVPVQFDDIRVGDYIIGTGRPDSVIPGTTHQGFVVLASSGDGVKIRQDNGAETMMGRPVRTFTRRTHAMNPALHLVDPGAIRLGDKVTLYDGATALDSGVTVDSLSPCTIGEDGWDIYLSSSCNRCTGYNPSYQWFRHTMAPLPENWDSLGKVSNQTLYPTIHHLKAAIFDLLAKNVDNKTWCEDGASQFARRYYISPLSPEDREASAQVVNNTIARLQGETAQFLGISQAELNEAFKTLSISQLPKTKRVQLEIEVPKGLTLDQIHEMLVGQQGVTVLRNQEVSR